MRTKVFALLAGLALGTAAMVGVGVVQAEKPDFGGADHRHYFLAGNGEKVYIGPDICDISMSEQGWEAFHLKVHVATAGAKLAVARENCPL